MASELDRLSVVLEAETRPLRQGLERAERKIDSFSRGHRRAFERNARATQTFNRSIMRMGAAVAAVAAPAVLGAFIQRSLAAAESIQDLSDRAGVSAEFLQSMRYAASQSGAETRDFDDAISRLNRRLGLFQQYLATGEGEAGAAAGAFRAMGLETRIASGELATAQDVFQESVRIIGGMESASQRAALASQLFGEDSGPRLQTLLARGEDGIRSLTDRARELGIVMDNEMVRKGAEASDQLETLGMVIRNNLTRAVVTNAEEINDMATAFTNALPGMIQLATDLADQMARVFGSGSADPINAMQAQVRLTRVGALAGQLRQDIETDAPIPGINSTDLRRRFQTLMGDGALDQINTQVRGEGLGFMAFGALRGSDALARQQELMLEALRDEAERVRALKRGFETSEDALEEPVTVDPTRPGAGGNIPTPRLAPRPPESSEGITVAAPVRAAYEAAEAELQEVAEAFERDMAFGIENALRVASDGNLVEYFARNLQNAVFQSVSQGLASAFAEQFANSAAGSFFSGLFTGSFGGPKRAAGGSFGGGAMLVGEAGPEIVATRSAGTVLSAAATRALAGGMANASGGGGQTVHVHQQFHLHAEGAVMTPELLAQMDQKASGAAAMAVSTSRKDLQNLMKRQSKALRR